MAIKTMVPFYNAVMDCNLPAFKEIAKEGMYLVKQLDIGYIFRAENGATFAKRLEMFKILIDDGKNIVKHGDIAHIGVGAYNYNQRTTTENVLRSILSTRGMKRVRQEMMQEMQEMQDVSSSITDEIVGVMQEMKRVRQDVSSIANNIASFICGGSLSIAFKENTLSNVYSLLASIPSHTDYREAIFSEVKSKMKACNMENSYIDTAIQNISSFLLDSKHEAAKSIVYDLTLCNSSYARSEIMMDCIKGIMAVLGKDKNVDKSFCITDNEIQQVISLLIANGVSSQSISEYCTKEAGSNSSSVLDAIKQGLAESDWVTVGDLTAPSETDSDYSILGDESDMGSDWEDLTEAPKGNLTGVAPEQQGAAAAHIG